MTDDVRLLASPAHEASRPKTLRSVGRRHVQYFNQNNRRTGTLWAGRYHLQLCRPDPRVSAPVFRDPGVSVFEDYALVPRVSDEDGAEPT